MGNILKAIVIKENTLNISSNGLKIKRLLNCAVKDVRLVMTLNKKVPTIIVCEDDKKLAEYIIEPLNSNPDLSGQFLHMSISITEDAVLFIDGVLSRWDRIPLQLDSLDLEAIRFQPLFLSGCLHDYKELIGKGLFSRGLHFSGLVTPGNTRFICICDYCRTSFSIKSFHSGFSDVHYFYSEDGMQTLVVSAWEFGGLPGVLNPKADMEKITEIECQLPLPTFGEGKYKYYNSFRCPRCKKPYIDFERYPEDRPGEYYGNLHLNREIQSYSKGI